MTEIERVQATIARVRAKLRAATDEESKDYYRKCLAGWERHLNKLQAENANADAFRS